MTTRLLSTSAVNGRWSRASTIIFMLFVSVPYLSAQTRLSGVQIHNPITPVQSLPSTCDPYGAYYLTTTKTAYICTAPNTFTALSAISQGQSYAVQGSSGTGTFADTGCTAEAGAMTCSGGFGSSGPFSAGGLHQSAASAQTPPGNWSSLMFDADHAGHLVRKDSDGGLHDLEAVKIGGYEVGSENASSALATGDLTSHSFIINDANPKTLSEASCVADAGSQTVTVSISGTAAFTITCVPFSSYSASATDGSSGYITAASMSTTTITGHARLDLSATANGTTKDIKLHLWGATK